MKRAEYLAENYNPRGYSASTVMDIIHNVDKACDLLNEKTGKKRKAGQMYKTVLKRLGHKIENDNILNDLVSKINRIFFEYPPVMLNKNILPIVSTLKHEGYTLNISSNTGFIEGPFLRKFLRSIEIEHYFDFAIFSDEIEASKPSWSFFENVYKNTGHSKEEVLHIGDNYNADYLGASKFGFNALLIDKEYSYELIKQTIDEKNRKF